MINDEREELATAAAAAGAAAISIVTPIIACRRLCLSVRRPL